MLRILRSIPDAYVLMQFFSECLFSQKFISCPYFLLYYINELTADIVLLSRSNGFKTVRKMLVGIPFIVFIIRSNTNLNEKINRFYI